MTMRFEDAAARPVSCAGARRAWAWLVGEWRELAHLPPGLRSKGKA